MGHSGRTIEKLGISLREDAFTEQVVSKFLGQI